MKQFEFERILVAFGLLTIVVWPAFAGERSAEKTFGEPKHNQALVYFIREGHYVGKSRTLFLYADETFLGVLENNSYTFAFLPPGEYLLWQNWARANSEVTLEAAKTYYFDAWQGFHPLDEELGQSLIEAVESYVVPVEKEVAKSENHIQERYSKAQEYAASEPEDHDQYAGTKSKREEHIADWPKVDLAPYTVLIVEDFAMADPKASKRKKQHLVEAAPQRLTSYLVANLGDDAFREVRTQVSAADQPGVLVIRGEITQYKPGSESSRMMMAGTGSAHFDFVAHLVDGLTGKEISTLSGKRTWSWGGGYGASRGIESIEKNVAYEIALYLKRARGLSDEEVEQ